MPHFISNIFSQEANFIEFLSPSHFSLYVLTVSLKLKSQSCDQGETAVSEADEHIWPWDLLQIVSFRGFNSQSKQGGTLPPYNRIPVPYLLHPEAPSSFTVPTPKPHEREGQAGLWDQNAFWKHLPQSSMQLGTKDCPDFLPSACWLEGNGNRQLPLKTWAITFTYSSETNVIFMSFINWQLPLRDSTNPRYWQLSLALSFAHKFQIQTLSLPDRFQCSLLLFMHRRMLTGPC